MKGKYAVHINLQGGPAFKDFERTEGQGTLKIILAAKEAGVEYLTSISGSSVDEKNTWFPAIKAKYAAENYIKSSGIPYTIFRPTWFMESLPLFVRGNKASVIGNNPHKYSWVAAKDYAHMVADAYVHQAAQNKTVFVYGPGKFTTLDALERYCAIKYPEIKPVVVPLGMIKTIALITMNKKLKMVAALMKYFAKTPEKDYILPGEFKLTKPETTLVDWAKTR